MHLLLNRASMIKKVLLVLATLVYGLSLPAQAKPNVVLFFVDDLGWTSLGYQDERLHTPNIDRLKTEGLYFERAY